MGLRRIEIEFAYLHISISKIFRVYSRQKIAAYKYNEEVVKSAVWKWDNGSCYF